ncbi:bifunctional 3'-5' exonuclease/DNA polymerase [Cryobacterium tepidiphilum]|uniref:DNA-directed DNA polymerase n=1 Tax=Cryobacterium tepidiphilum TaxID=2486026 RepID=A0A3M8LA62_9MICO|nr:bifunctional 3'-5' exonuclease/DNA polymerase [Cryobacterium tepidiphilum]RNE62397.1 bifunctional 3'-5' exonuclease/DNA polymerase [Cryobacterium tepidiphilum]
MYILVSRDGGKVLVAPLTDDGSASAPELTLSDAEFGRYVQEQDSAARWVWDDTVAWYPRLLAGGIRIARCHDLRLCHVILRHSTLSAGSDLASAPAGEWDASALSGGAGEGEALFELGHGGLPDPRGEFLRQLEAVRAATAPGRLRLLLAAESAGALVAAEMQFAGLPWRRDVHERLLATELGPRVPHGTRPERLERLAARIRVALEAPALNPDSPVELLRALKATGLPIASTRAFELRRVEHPVIEPLLEYKKRSRLLSANGWAWMDAWVVDGRFHPEYLPGGVVTGRWAARGGGALQLPKQVRGAVVADDGWKLVVADAAQLEPRILAGLAADVAMADAGRGTDLYAGIVAGGVVETRQQAKGAMLGAMYGATTGQGGQLLPRLAAAYPRAVAAVEAAARLGERGDVVTTLLGRSSPRPDAGWRAAQAQASQPGATAADERRARSQAREWGRFTRNFIVQGSAAEWALCWLAEIRKELWEVGTRADASPGGSPAPFRRRPHLVFFLHDEVIVHTPEALAKEVAEVVREAAARAGRLLFGEFPVDFPLSARIVDNYAEVT